MMFTRERHRRGVLLLRPVRERQEGARDARRPEPRLPLPSVRRGRSRAGTPAIPCLDYHIDRCHCALRRLHHSGGLRRDLSTASRAVSLGRPLEPIKRELERQMRAAADEERFEDAARYRNRLFSIQHLAERQAADRRAVGDVDVLGSGARGRPRRRPDLPASRRQDDRSLLVPRRERRGAGRQRPCSRRSASSITAPPVGCRRRSSCRRRRGDLSPGRKELLSERRGSHVEVRLCALRRQAPPPPSRLWRTRATPSTSDQGRRPSTKRAAPRRGARGAPRGAQPRVASAAHRVLRHLDDPGRRDRRLARRVRGRRPRRRRTTASSRCVVSTVRTIFAAMAEVGVAAVRPAARRAPRPTTTRRSRRRRTSS